VSSEAHQHGNSAADLNRLIAQAEKHLAQLDRERTYLLKRLAALREQRAAAGPAAVGPQWAQKPPGDELVSAVRRLFRGREDVYAQRWESSKTGRSESGGV